MSMMTFKSNLSSSKTWKISSIPNANKTSLLQFSSPTSNPKTGSLVLKPWKISNNNTPKEHSFFTTSPIVQLIPLFTTQSLKHVSNANPQIQSSTCSQNNVITAKEIRKLMFKKEFANQNHIIQILLKWRTGISMAEICLKSTKIWLHVQTKNHITTELFVFHVIGLCTGVSLQIFVRNAKKDFLLIWTPKIVKK